MNIIEIKERLHIDNDLCSTEIIEYVKQRLERRGTSSYKESLFKIINRIITTSPFTDYDDYRIFHCSHDNEIYVEEHSVELPNGNFICQNAYLNHYSTCDRCDDVINNSQIRNCYDSDNNYCEHCFDQVSNYCDECDQSYLEECECDQCDRHERSNLDEYTEKNPLHYLGKENDYMFYGVEIEVQVYEHQSRNRVVDMFRDCFNQEQTNIVCKRDGSLHPQKGFEMSSTNCSFDYHKNRFWNDFYELKPAQYCKAYEGKDCGIHIHFNRNAYTENNLRSLNCFYNNPKNRNLIVDIAGRDEHEDYCRFIPSIGFDDPINTNGSSYKYRVINFNNKDTVEVRIFRSNLKQLSFFRYLEFVHTVNLWIKETDPTRYEKITWIEYFDWLLKNLSKDFSNLLFFLSKRNHFDHLETITEWQDIYTNYKTVITDFVNANQELIESEGE